VLLHDLFLDNDVRPRDGLQVIRTISKSCQRNTAGDGASNLRTVRQHRQLLDPVAPLGEYGPSIKTSNLARPIPFYRRSDTRISLGRFDPTSYEILREDIRDQSIDGRLAYSTEHPFSRDDFIIAASGNVSKIRYPRTFCTRNRFEFRNSHTRSSLGSCSYPDHSSVRLQNNQASSPANGSRSHLL